MSFNGDRRTGSGRPRYAALVRLMHCTLTAALVLICGCAGVGILATSDPAIKLSDAEVLYQRKDRPLRAEMLIREAVEIYQQQDDAHGLGHAYRDYSEFLTSPAVTRLENAYRAGKVHFLDPSVAFDSRLDKSREYSRRALEEYEIATKRERNAGQFGALTNVYYNLAWLRILLGEKKPGCADFDRSVAAYRENMRRNPGAHPVFPSGYASLPDAAAAAKRRAGCPETDLEPTRDAAD